MNKTLPILLLIIIAALSSCRRSSYSKFPVHEKAKTEKPNEIHPIPELVVKNIRIKILAPFGRDVLDTNKYDNAFIKRALNTTHVYTRESTVRKLLLFEAGDTVTAFELTESERLLRKNLKIRDARIISAKNETTGTYDLLIIIQDQLEYNAGVSRLFETTTYSVLNRNMLGYGSTLSLGFGYNDKRYDHFSVGYNDPSIGKSYIDLSLNYTDAARNFTKGIVLNRKMVSGLLHTGGGIGYTHTNSDRFFFRGDTVYSSYNSDIRYISTWAGHTFPLEKASNPRKNIVNYGVAASYTHAEEQIRDIVSDTINPISPINKSGDRFLMGVGLSYSRFYKDSYIFRFPYTEDIPEGFKIMLLGGKGFNRYNSDNFYSGIQLGVANNFNWGYINASGQYLRYISGFKPLNNSGSTLKLIYMSPALEKNKFRNRIFFTGNIKRIGNDIAFDRIYLNNEDGFLNVNSRTISGVTKTSFILNNILYTPYRPLGFNIGFFAYGAIANLNSSRTIRLVGKWYQAYGLGILLRNENLLINSVRLSFTFYPSFPEATYKLNPLWIYDLQIPDMNFTEPEVDL